MKNIWTVLKKECLDNIRDRRTIISSFSLSLLGPILFVGLMTFILNQALGESDDAVAFTLIGAEHAPTLANYLKQANTDITHTELPDGSDPRDLVRDGDEDLVLVIPADYGERYRSGQLNNLSLIFDSSELGSAARRARSVREIVNGYATRVGLMRLQVRGINPSVAQPVSVRTVDVASPAQRALAVLSMIPYFMLMVAFMGGFYLAIDTTVGEREHGSLEPLLTQPLPRAHLVLGKIGATATFAFIGLALFLIGFYLSLPLVPLERIGMSLEVGFGAIVNILLVMLPLLWFAAAVLTVTATFAKSYKEAQTYLSLLILVPTLPVIFTQLAGVESTPWLMLIPSLSQSLLIKDLITSEPIATLDVALSVLCTSLVALVLTWLAIRMYRRERFLV